MLHRCHDCLNLYLTSDYPGYCDLCGSQQRQRLELQEVDEVVEWWILMTQANWGIEPERTRRWWI